MFGLNGAAGPRHLPGHPSQPRQHLRPRGIGAAFGCGVRLARSRRARNAGAGIAIQPAGTQTVQSGSLAPGPTRVPGAGGEAAGSARPARRRARITYGLDGTPGRTRCASCSAGRHRLMTMRSWLCPRSAVRLDSTGRRTITDEPRAATERRAARRRGHRRVRRVGPGTDGSRCTGGQGPTAERTPGGATTCGAAIAPTACEGQPTKATARLRRRLPARPSRRTALHLGVDHRPRLRSDTCAPSAARRVGTPRTGNAAPGCVRPDPRPYVGGPAGRTPRAGHAPALRPRPAPPHRAGRSNPARTDGVDVQRRAAWGRDLRVQAPAQVLPPDQADIGTVPPCRKTPRREPQARQRAARTPRRRRRPSDIAAAPAGARPLGAIHPAEPLVRLGRRGGHISPRAQAWRPPAALAASHRPASLVLRDSGDHLVARDAPPQARSRREAAPASAKGREREGGLATASKPRVGETPRPVRQGVLATVCVEAAGPPTELRPDGDPIARDGSCVDVVAPSGISCHSGEPASSSRAGAPSPGSAEAFVRRTVDP
jgi:hypothetical protein